MRTPIWTSILLLMTTFLQGCGGGGDNAGTCSGSKEWCAEHAAISVSNTGTTSITNNSTTALFSKTGSGDTVFDIPSSVTRIRIQGNFNGSSANFMVAVAGSTVVNELLGTSWRAVPFDGTYLLKGGGTVQITNSSGVTWTFTEVR